MKYDEELKKKMAFCVAISEIHAVLAVLCEIDKAIALHGMHAAHREVMRARLEVSLPNSQYPWMVSPDIDWYTCKSFAFIYQNLGQPNKFDRN